MSRRELGREDEREKLVPPDEERNYVRPVPVEERRAGGLRDDGIVTDGSGRRKLFGQKRCSLRSSSKIHSKPKMVTRKEATWSALKIEEIGRIKS